MTTRHDDTGNFASFHLGLNRARRIMRELADARDTDDFGELLVTITFEGSHVKALLLELAKASNKEVK